MARVIKSIEIIHQHEEGPDYYEVGSRYEFGKITIGDIIEDNGIYKVFDTEDKLYMEIKNCPVVVRYVNESDLNREETFYFTFGVGQELGGYCQPIQAKNHHEARKKMIELHGSVWAFQYSESQWREAVLRGYANEKLLTLVKA